MYLHETWTEGRVEEYAAVDASAESFALNDLEMFS